MNNGQMTVEQDEREEARRRTLAHAVATMVANWASERNQPKRIRSVKVSAKRGWIHKPDADGRLLMQSSLKLPVWRAYAEVSYVESVCVEVEA